MSYSKLMRRFAAVTLTLAFIMSLTPVVLARSATEDITVNFPRSIVYIDESPIYLQDASGNTIEPFAYEGTTYLPVRAIAGAMNMDVGWNGETNTVTLTTSAQQSAPKPVLSLYHLDAYDETIKVTYSNIKININGKTFTPKDADGKTVEPFACNGSVYLPVRAIANALGKEVHWDSETNSIYIGIYHPAYHFSENRVNYRLDLTAEGTAVVNRLSGKETLVPFGQKIVFSGMPKYSKDTGFIVHNVRTQTQAIGDWASAAVLPVDYLMSGIYIPWGDKTPQECISERFDCPWKFPDQQDKAVVAYINMTEYSHGNGRADPSFDPAWDKDNDAMIDDGAGPLPEYVDTKVYDNPWKSYVAQYWTDSWREQMKQKIDLAAAENFDGVMLDVMTGYWCWKQTYPSMDLNTLRERIVDLVKWIHDYAKIQYGSAFLVAVNLDQYAYQYFPDLGAYVDSASYQNAFFSWDGSGVVDGYGLSVTKPNFSNPSIDFLRAQGLSVLDVDQLGTGPVSADLIASNYDDKVTEENLLLIFRWAIDAGSTPSVTPVYTAKPFSDTPRITRILPGLKPETNTMYNDWVLGGDDADVISTAAGVDMIYGGPGDDQIDGGAGIDSSYYLGPHADYEVVRVGDTVVVTAKSGSEGRDTLTNIERLIFSDKTVSAP